MLNSLGNIHETPRAGFVFPDFDTGSVLYITGTAETLFDAAARALMPDSDVLTTVYVTGLALVVDALPLRHANAHFSAYSPPVRFLAEEIQDKVTAEPIVHLVNATVLTPTLTHYTFRAPHALSNFKPAGTVILDLRRTFGHRTGHDDCVRTWTVSHPPSAARPDEFGLTLRTAAGGVITPLLAAAVRDRGAEVTVADLGIFGALRGASSNVAVPTPGKHLWIAGGIGSTPFLALSRYISTQPGLWDITLFLSTGEPTVLPMLFAEALAGASDVRFALHIFTNEKFDPATLALPNFFMVRVHAGRIPTDGKLFADVDAPSRHVHICGPLPFVNNAMAGLENAGIDPEMVFRERFTY
jgi:ferredoxin-NADP reductase